MRNDPACRGVCLFRLSVCEVEFGKQIRNHMVRMQVSFLGCRDIPQHFVIPPRDIPEHRVAADPHALAENFVALPVVARFVQRIAIVV